MIDELVNIIKIKESSLSSITEFLDIVKEYSRSKGLILWELDSKIDYLFTVAYHFDNQRIPVHALPFHESITGRAIKQGQPIYIPDISESEFYYKKTSFWKDLNIQSFFSIPIIFINGEKGALNFYSEIRKPYSDNFRSRLEIFANILPKWYKALQDRATYSLLEKVDNVLNKIEFPADKKFFPKVEIGSHLESLCSSISDIFQTFETSIFLNDPFTSFDDFECLGSTWIKETSKWTYKAEEREGLTGYILFTKKPVYIPDLQLFKNTEQASILQKKYPRIIWNGKGDILTEIAHKHKINIESGETSPPVGFMGAPIFFGEKVVGVIRCCAALKSPYYFGTRELEILKLVASRVGDIWNSWIQSNRSFDDSESWKNILTTTNSLDFFVLKELEKMTPDPDQIFQKVLQSIPHLIKDAEILDVRLYDEKYEDLYFYSCFGDAWDQGSIEEITNRYEKRFPVDNEKPQSAGEVVFRLKEALLLDPIDKSEHPYDETFKGTTRMILAPLLVRDKVIGVLDVRSTKPTPFPKSAKHIVEMMAGQLAIYYELTKAVSDVRMLQREQMQTFKDFAHQFRSPVYQARVRSKFAMKELKNEKITEELRYQLTATAGLCSKASRVAKNLRLFSDLAKDKPISIRKGIVRMSTMLKLVSESADDNAVIIDSRRRIDITVEKSSFAILESIDLELDKKMLEQCLNALLDNAAKYSYTDTEISIFAKITTISSRDYFQVTVRNKGLVVTKEEAPKCSYRGWQGENAQAAKGEGEGIGLWVVKKIMEAHKGSLSIIPTDKKGFTNIVLNFPVKSTR